MSSNIELLRKAARYANVGYLNDDGGVEVISLFAILAEMEADKAKIEEQRAWIETARESEMASFESRRNLSTYMTAPSNHNFNLTMSGLDVVSRDCFAAMLGKVGELQARIAKLEAVVEKLPKTKDGKPIIIGESIFAEYDSDDLPTGTVVEEKVDGVILYRGEICVQCGGCEYETNECYSTREAALAALEGGQHVD